MGNVKVNLGGLKDLNLQLRKVIATKRKEVDAELQVATEEMERGAKRDAPADQATLREGITNEKVGELQWVLKSNAAYSVYMEFGTKGRYQAIPGVDPSEFNKEGVKNGKGFYDSILDWVKRKKIIGTYSVKSRKRIGSKIDQQIEDEQAAFAIYLSIIRHGVKPHPFFFKQLDVVKPKLIRNIQNVLNG